MTKLKKFKFNNKISSRNMIISFAIILCLLIILIISKSYAIYKIQKKYDVIKNKVGEFSKGDVKIIIFVDGKEATKALSYEDNYKLEKIECTNDIQAEFDIKNWQINISDFNENGGKCSIYFDSKNTNDELPLAYTREELLALNEEYKNLTVTNLKNEALDDYYPVGSIYMSTEDDTVEKVQNKFGGTWVKFSEGKTLIGDDGVNYITNDATKGSGGSSTTTLAVGNLPSHNHSYTPSGRVTSSYSGSVVNTSTAGNHAHTIYGITADGYNTAIRFILQGDANAVLYTNAGTAIWNSGTYGKASGSSYRSITLGLDSTTSTNGNHYHSVTAAGSVSSSFTGTAANTQNTGNTTAINIQNPYTALYMYKRTT